jgi:hypothetical protein
MKRLLKILAVAVVVVLVFTYAMYVWDYKGNYNVTISVPVHGDGAAGENPITASGISAACEPTSIWQFWSGLSTTGSSGSGLYTVYCELNMYDMGTWYEGADGSVQFSMNSVTHHHSLDISSGQDVSVTFTFDNIEPGRGNVHVYIVDVTVNATVYDDIWEVTVG